MKHSIELLELESGTLAKHVSSVSTVTFFKGDLSKLQISIKERFSNILKVNPWLGGSLSQSRGQNVRLSFDDVDVDADALFHMCLNVDINLENSYENISLVASEFTIKSAKHIINSDKKVCSLTLIQSSTDTFAMIFSLSHSIVDGHSYYKILNMLSDTSEIHSLSVIRKHTNEVKMKEMIGKDIYDYFMGKAHVINAFLGVFFGKRSKAYAFYVDESRITDIKKSHCAFEVCDYLSTNDILTSTFGTFIKARLLSMAMNFRGKIKDLNDDDAGNYEGAVLHDEISYANPYGIRSSISSQPYSGVHKTLPTFKEGIKCRMGLITNWASFSKELCFKGAKEVLHLPLNTASRKMPYEIAIVFRPHDDKLAVMYYSSRFYKDDYIYSELPISSLVSKELFA